MSKDNKYPDELFLVSHIHPRHPLIETFQGVFVLRDARFRWLLPFTADDEATRRAAATVLNFPCGLIKGALENLGITSTVQAEVSPAVPSCSFTIKIKASAKQQGQRG